MYPTAIILVDFIIINTDGAIIRQCLSIPPIYDRSLQKLAKDFLFPFVILRWNTLRTNNSLAFGTE